MSQKQDKRLSATCRCGKVEFETAGPPIVSVSCYCTSCQEAGRRFEQLHTASPVPDPDGGTGFILYRKDRVRCEMGQEHLEEHRLKPESPTRRVVATCCNSAMFLEFNNGHWLSMYRNRFTTDAPPLEMRTNDWRAGVELAGGVPNLSTHSGKFMFKLLAAWVAMGFRRPKIIWGKAAKAPEKVAMENVDSPGRPVRVDADKYNAMMRAMLAVLLKSPPGLTVAELKPRLLPLLPEDLFPEGARPDGGSRACSSILKRRD